MTVKNRQHTFYVGEIPTELQHVSKTIDVKLDDSKRNLLLVEFQQHQSLANIQRNLLLLLQLSVDKKTSLSKRIFEFVQFVTMLQSHSQKLKIL